ncbi:MAG: hypothetical protein ACQKBV_05455 [Puniceicoccales bacterium]
MPKTDSQETDKISLEELLQFKRCEQPDAEFWRRFDRELNAKPWQGMVKKPSLLQRLRERTGLIASIAVPAGASAAFALSVTWVGPTAVTADKTLSPAVDSSPADLLAAVDSVPVAEVAAPVAESAPQLPSSADSHFVVGSFSTSEASSDPVFTTVASTHYMPTSQRDGVHFAYNALERAAHQSVAMATGPVRSFY